MAVGLHGHPMFQSTGFTAPTHSQADVSCRRDGEGGACGGMAAVDRMPGA
jgi:hypothetical protein